MRTYNPEDNTKVTAQTIAHTTVDILTLQRE